METQDLTRWERHEQAHLLACETEPWQQKRRIAEDPATPADVLAQIASEVEAADKRNTASSTRNDDYLAKRKTAALLAQALVAHPNTPPLVLARLLGRQPLPSRAFCSNPIAPFLLLETPNFAERLRGVGARYGLLHQGNAPPALVAAIAALPNMRFSISPGMDEEVWEVRLHIALAGEIQTQAEWEEQFKTYWREKYAGIFVLRADPSDTEKVLDEAFWRSDVQTFWDLYEIGLMPAWAGKPVEPMEPCAPALIPQATEWLRFTTAPNTSEEDTLWAQIAPHLAAHPELADGIRVDASETALADLADLGGTKEGMPLLAVIAAHPNTTPRVMERILETKPYGEILRLLALHPNVSPQIIAQLVRCSDAETRRLARRHPAAPGNAVELSRAGFLNREQNGSHFERLIACLHDGLALDVLVEYAITIASYLRILAALGLPVQPIPIPNSEFAGGTTRDLMEHLARDGNRLVRWVAQTRLADPKWQFNIK